MRKSRESARQNASWATSAAGVLVLLFAACAQKEQPAAKQEPTPAPAAQTSAAALEEHTIEVGTAFTPASVTVKAGRPARLHFRRGDEATCADEIVLPDLDIRKKLAANQTVTIDIPAQQARTLSFACGMDMMKGTVIVQ